MDQSSNSLLKISTLQLKPDEGKIASTIHNSRNMKKHTKRDSSFNNSMNVNNPSNQNFNATKNTFKETKGDWKSTSKSDWSNVTGSNWNQQKAELKKDGSFKSSIHSGVKIGAKGELPQDNKVQEPQTMMDQIYGQGYKPIQIEQCLSTEFEGSEPQRIDDLEQYYIDEFEINETDEDMYSESNAHSRSELEKVRSQKKKNRNCYRYQSVEPHSIEYNSNIDADAKIKQKIMEKYSKNPKQKILLQQQMLSFNKTEVIFESKPKMKNMSQMDTSVNRFNNNIYLVFPNKSEISINDLPITRVEMSPNRKIQCNSQSPLRSSVDSLKNLNEPQQPFIIRNTQNNFYLSQKQYDNSNIENHIAFRNSFYANDNKQKFNNLKKSAVEFQNTKQRQNRHKEELKDINEKDEEFYDKYAQKFKINRNELSEKGRGQERKRMQTPNQQFKSEYLAPK